MKSLFESHMNLTEKVLNLRLERQNLVASNIANIDTPGYKARRLKFEEQLQSALELNGQQRMTKTSTEHIPHRFNPEECDGEFYKENLDQRVVQGNDSVDLDKEMAIMAKNTLLYNAMATVLKKNFDGLQTIIQEGSK